MKKLLKVNLILIFTIIISAFIIAVNPIFAAQTPVASSIPANTSTTQTQAEQPMVKTQSIPQKNAYQLTHMEKKGFKYAVFKFFISMFWVIVSALLIFLGLKFYKKMILKNNAKIDKIDYDKTLESPKDFKEAINLFLDKTDK